MRKTASLGIALFLLTGTGSAHAASTTTYTYDALGRLTNACTAATAVTCPPAAPTAGTKVMSTTYDPADNRVTYQVTGSASKVVVVPINGLTVIPVPDN